MHEAATLVGGNIPAHVPGAYPSLSCCGGEIRLVPVEPLCDCGHALDQHQTGEGPWTGFCGGADRHVGSDGDLTDQCECESPTVNSQTYLAPTYNADGICPRCGVAASDRERLLDHDDWEASNI